MLVWRDSRTPDRTDQPIVGRTDRRTSRRIASWMRFFTTRPGPTTLAWCKPVSTAFLERIFYSGRRLEVTGLQQSGSRRLGREIPAVSSSGAPEELRLANSDFEKVCRHKPLQYVACVSAKPGLARGYLLGRAVLSASLARRRKIGEIAVGRVG